MRTEEEIIDKLYQLYAGLEPINIYDNANDILSRIDTTIRIDMLKWVLERD